MRNSAKATGTPVPVSVKAGKLLSWATFARLLNALPWGMCECGTIDEAKGYAKVLLIFIAVILLSGLEKGGAL